MVSSIFSVDSCFTIATSYYTFVFAFVLFCFFWGGGLFIFNWTCIMKNYVTEINRISLRPIRSNYFTKLRNNHELKCLFWELTYLNPIYNLHYSKWNLVHWFKPLFELCCLFSGSTVFIPLPPVNKEFPISYFSEEMSKSLIEMKSNTKNKCNWLPITWTFKENWRRFHWVTGSSS